MAKVSIIMPCFNEEKHLARTISSVQKQSFVDWELIVVDDGSTDNSFDLLQKLIREDTRIRAIKNDIGKGVASALNCGIFCSRGEYIARWDADDQCYSARLEKMVEYLDGHPDVGVVGCGVEKRIYSSEKLLRTETFTYVDNHQALLESLSRLVAIGANCMCRKKVFEQVGVFDCDLGGEEELDFLIRAAEYGMFGYVPDILYIYNVIEGKSRSLKGRMRKKLIMARLNLRAIRKFHLSPVNYIYPLVWLFYAYFPLPIKTFIRQRFSEKRGANRE